MMSNLAFKDLMRIWSPREAGNHTAPLMNRHFRLPGVMDIQTPKADEDATMAIQLVLHYDGLMLSYDGALLSYDAPVD